MSDAGRIAPPEAVKEIARRLESAGYETWAVGGAVRDALAPRPRPHPDWDLATRARPEEVRKLFRRSYPIGIEFGTVGVRGADDAVYEVTSFRRDVSTDGRHAVVEYADTLDEDLARRDFTINAIAYHPLRQQVHDPYGGRQDLKAGVLRCVGQPALRFAEDYLRVLRGLRFAGSYDLRVDPPTWTALTDAVGGLGRLSRERVREELIKLLEAPGARRSLELYRGSGALAELIPALAEQPEGEWRRAAASVERLPQERTDLRLAALLAPVAPETEPILRGLKCSNAEIGDTRDLTRGLGVPLPEPEEPASVRRWVHAVGPDRATDVLNLRRARAEADDDDDPDRLARLEAVESAVQAVLERGEPVALEDLAIDGNDLKSLGLEPGPIYGRVLEECLQEVLEDPERNRRDRLLALVADRHLRRHGK